MNETIKVVTDTIAEKEVQTVEITQPTPAPRRVPVDMYVRQLTQRQTMLQKQLDDVTAQIQALTDAGVDVAKLSTVKPMLGVKNIV